MALKQIHPQIDDETECKLRLMGVKPSQALKEYANNSNYASKKIDDDLNLLNAKKDFYLSIIKDAQKEIEKIDTFIKNKNHEKEKLLEMHKNDYKTARNIIKQRFKQIKQETNNAWGVKKMSDNELNAICLQYGLTSDVLLNGFTRKELKSVLENYDKYL